MKVILLREWEPFLVRELVATRRVVCSNKGGAASPTSEEKEEKKRIILGLWGGDLVRSQIPGKKGH